MTAMYSRIRTVSDGEQITQPGIYEVPIRRYHHDPNLFPGHSVSSTGLRRILNLSPKHYWAHCVHNPNRIPSKTSEALRFGKGVHSFLLERKLSPQEFAICPFKDWNTNEKKEMTWRETIETEDVLGEKSVKVLTQKGWKDENGNKFKNYLEYKKMWKAFAEWADLTIITEKDIAKFKDMALALSDDPVIRDGLFDGEVEKTIVWQDPQTGIWVKIRPDVVPSDKIMADYKSVRSAKPVDVDKSISEYGYDMQMALFQEGISRVLGKTIESAVLVPQEKEPPHVHEISVIDPNTLWWGARQNRKALDKLGACLEAGEFGGYTEGPATSQHANWKMTQLLNQHEFDPFPEIPGNYLETIAGKVKKG